ncbi:MarR family winged helix-turn-helix transcriptional regulator [Sphaerisporangium sp. NPDC088356]|uniref:MarR family winged helix-turn-helix transcriptional regulator n=1 Tax=Sphaerisporangium sp. NPDC088356 TaxID=3154871 RepID=UPI0034224F3F
MTETRWLDEREQRMWRAFGSMRRQLDSAMERHLNGERLSMADYQLLVPLSEAPGGRIRARELRGVVGWDRSRLSHQLRRMEQRGLICREDCPGDARGTVIRLTPEGRSVIETAAPGHVETVRRLFVDVLTPDEIEILTSIANRVLGRIAHDAFGPGGVAQLETAGPCSAETAEPGTGAPVDQVSGETAAP